MPLIQQPLQKAKADPPVLSVFTTFFTHQTTNHFLRSADALQAPVNQARQGKLSNTEAKWHEASGT